MKVKNLQNETFNYLAVIISTTIVFLITFCKFFIVLNLLSISYNQDVNKENVHIQCNMV